MVQLLADAEQTEATLLIKTFSGAGSIKSHPIVFKCESQLGSLAHNGQRYILGASVLDYIEQEFTRKAIQRETGILPQGLRVLFAFQLETKSVLLR
jgi:hypothetical protein